MVKSEIINNLRKKYKNLNNSQISEIVDAIFLSISKSLIKNKAVEIRIFGRYSIKIIKAKHSARNPRTNEIIYVPERKKVSFKMSKHLKDRVNN